MKWIADLLRRRREDREVGDEVAAHLEEKAADFMDAGLTEEEARQKARREFGNVGLSRQNSREAWGWVWMETFLQDLRYGVRMLRRNPGFTLVAVGSLALGIGVNAAMFSLADGLLLRPLSVRRPGEVVTVRGTTPNNPSLSFSYRDYVTLRERSQSFDGLVAYTMWSFGFSARPGDLPRMKVGLLVSSNLFGALGVEPELGRGFRREEDQAPGRDAVVVLGHDFWENELGGDRSIIGRKVRLNGVDFTVIGVAPERFTGLDQYLRPAMFLPLMMAPRLAASPDRDFIERRAITLWSVKGRLKSGVSRAQAQTELAAIAKGLARQYPDTNRDRSVAVLTELQTRFQRDPPDIALVAMLMTLAGLVLLVACANIANLLLSRARARTREVAIRLAIGAGRMRLIRQLLAESLAIALAGGAASLLFAYAGTAFLSRIQIPTDLPMVLTVEIDARMLWFSLAGLAVVACCFSDWFRRCRPAAPIWCRCLKAANADSLRKQRLWGRNALVVVQVALSLVLLVVSAVLARGFRAELMSGPGFRTDHLLMMSFDPTLVRSTAAQTQQFYKALRERALATPGVKSAALSLVVPMSTDQRAENLVPEGYQLTKDRTSVQVFTDTVDEHYFDTMAVPIVRGRAFRESDTADAPHVAVVNEQFAGHYWPNRDAIGQRFRLGAQGPWVEIVGVAKTAKYLWIGEGPTEFVYFPLAQHPSFQMTLLAQSFGDAAGLAAPLREMVRKLDPNQPVYGVRTMADFYQMRAVNVPGMINTIIGAMGLVGLLLAMTGLYGLMAYSVSRRTREIGIRMAIGAGRGSVERMVLRQGFRAGGHGAGPGAGGQRCGREGGDVHIQFHGAGSAGVRAGGPRVAGGHDVRRVGAGASRIAGGSYAGAAVRVSGVRCQIDTKLARKLSGIPDAADEYDSYIGDFYEILAGGRARQDRNGTTQPSNRTGSSIE